MFQIGKGFKITSDSKNYSIKIGPSFKARLNLLIYVENQSEIIIGENVFFNNNCSVNCMSSIKIGQNTIIGEGVKFYDHNHKFYFDNIERLKISRNDFNTAPIVVGENCWIGSNVTILKGVTIGDNVIIGANCLLYQSVPSNTVVKNKSELYFDINRQ
jgi:acetyltransferase-like isoleucine patch superfamily enzyme